MRLFGQFRALPSVPNSQISISPNFVNRNPRNLERLRIGYKPDGYHLERPLKHTYWHKLRLTESGRYVTATVHHFENGDVLRASTSEWALKEQLYRGKDKSAYINLGRVLADRCLKAGLLEIASDISPPNSDGRVALFLKAMEEGGVSLEEPPQYKNSFPTDQHRPEKPWEITDD